MLTSFESTAGVNQQKYGFTEEKHWGIDQNW